MATEPVRVVAAACDGACSGNPGPGGWGCLLRFEDGSVRELGGAAAATTNNRMELTAALAMMKELRNLPLHPDLRLRTDSRYLIDGLTKWMPGWKRKGWRTASGGPVLNRDLWEELDRARLPGLSLAHVKGHSGDPDNDRCDAIAVAYSRGSSPELAQPEGDGLDQPAPAALGELLTRLEVADRLASGGYALTTAELARLVEQPLARLQERQGPWIWRDWRVSPTSEGRWRLERTDPALQESR
ncbi:ribonuclease HI [Synechococcus sp. Cruz-9H2]|uniref:ribonuclease H family protein n=1 Tax=unclassified Synechococcus TaxID=2626047 RepID=UPI0020CBBD47|nr:MULTISPECIES: ribonuclease H [unclassified Synechococcus]MCP9818898.1 ribonuclease HI [Synechococcus sp. Cruz-9H2]MCP9843401.1 ribonuclease HI [Synechococcus sp. Edmonson 11F2]MCP9855216.1 ribonuclease HI [Synechococcus sp. Cruz-9C9]MCP9862811.1 ribonuclease HI [Synechococcus sp. Cruz-7E5]MCP9869808.1 ribonuclease HI [Synechococcus sp. Cruz-7B9]